VLAPRHPSHYRRVRREPRREALSTIEAAGLLLSELEGRPEIGLALTAALDRIIASVSPPVAGVSGVSRGSAHTSELPRQRRH
jgi:DTW domain-containing protein YfiP